jgi:long-chain acyl-CoA synthetase
MNPAIWVERHGRMRADELAIAEGQRVHATWATFAARTANAAAAFSKEFGL